MKKVILTLFTFSSFTFFGQTWADNVAEIVYEKCAKCHHQGGAAPGSLTTFAEASPMAAAMALEIEEDKMPPWPPDNNFNQYAHARSLTAAQKTTILAWVANGAPEGNPASTPPPPVFTSAWQLGEGDLTVRMPNYVSKATTEDDYICIEIPSGLAAGRTIRAVEVLPGNAPIVHHCMVFWDNPGGSNLTDTVGGDCGSPSGGTLIYGWAPGSTPLVFPAGNNFKLGMNIPANAKIILNIHYPIGSLGMMDSTKVKFHFYPIGETGIREVSADRLLQNWSFSLPAGQTTALSSTYPNGAGGFGGPIIPGNFSILSIFPHMHQLGKSIKVYGINAAADTIKLMNLPRWDFDWQGFYLFKNMPKVTTGSYLKQECVMENTTGATVFPGTNTSSEMFLTYFHFLPYVAGDELFDIENLTSLSTANLLEKAAGEDPLWTISPNPFSNDLTISFQGLQQGQIASMIVYDVAGSVIAKLIDKQSTTSSSLTAIWNGTSLSGAEASKGVYMISLNVNGKMYNKRVVKN